MIKFYLDSYCYNNYMKGIGSWGEKLVTMMFVNFAKIFRSLVYSIYLFCFIDNGFYSFDKKFE